MQFEWPWSKPKQDLPPKVEVLYSDLEIKLDSGHKACLSTIVENESSYITPYQTFHDWMLDEGSKNAGMFITYDKGGFYVYKNKVVTYDISIKKRYV